MQKWVWLVVVLVCRLIPVTAQDIDSNPLFQKRSVSGIADQITDPAERAVFLQLFLHAPAERLLASAQTFLNRFPQSSFLAQAYEVAARASFDLQNYEAGLDYARLSLSLSFPKTRCCWCQWLMWKRTGILTTLRSRMPRKRFGIWTTSPALLPCQRKTGRM